MAYDEELAGRVRDLFEQKGVRYEAKRMMGGLVFMVEGKMCVGIVADLLMVRLDPAVYEESLKKPGCGPMDFAGRQMRGFVLVRPEAIEKKSAFAYWVKLAMEFNPRAVASKKSVKRSTTQKMSIKHLKTEKKMPSKN